LVIDALNNNEQLTINKKMNADVLKTSLDGKRIILAKPQTFMNNSGAAVQSLLTFYKLEPSALVVIHDDKDVPLGETRVQRNRGAAGHNGVLSIIEHLGTKDFVRIRVGVAPKEQTIHNTADFVLGKFTKEEQKILKGVIEHVVEEVKRLVK
jgi:PTH1 family peptidyl-tRNA hydrolase